jgi:hypothetical protein
MDEVGADPAWPIKNDYCNAKKFIKFCIMF